MPPESYADSGTTKQHIASIKGRIDKLEKKMGKINKKVESIDVEIGAAKMLLEISEKNLTAPNWIFGFIIALTAVIAGLLAFIGNIIRKKILDDIEKERNKNKEEFKKLISIEEDLKNQQHQLFAYSYNMAALSAWGKERYDEAIRFEEKAIDNAEKAWGKEPEDSVNRIKIYRYRGNLAYFYVEKNRTDKKGEALEYAKKGLEVGLAIDDLNLIDSYLFITKRFSEEPEDKKQWLKIFEIYKNRIYEKKIRKEGNEQDEFDGYCEELKNQNF